MLRPTIQRSTLIASFILQLAFFGKRRFTRGRRTNPNRESSSVHTAKLLDSSFLGTGEFPKDVVLVVGVTPPDKILQSLTDPYRGGRSGVRNFLFHVPGMHFTILVGKTIEETLRSMCFVRNPLHPILVADFSTQLKRIYLDSTRNAHQSARIKKFLRGNRPE
jgi:hypothetical protein